MEIFHDFALKRDNYKARSGPLQRTMDFLSSFGFFVSAVWQYWIHITFEFTVSLSFKDEIRMNQNMMNRWNALQKRLSEYRKELRPRIALESTSVAFKVSSFQDKIKKVRILWYIGSSLSSLLFSSFSVQVRARTEWNFLFVLLFSSGRLENIPFPPNTGWYGEWTQACDTTSGAYRYKHLALPWPHWCTGGIAGSQWSLHQFIHLCLSL